MSRSKGRSAASKSGRGGRLQTVGLFATFVLVAVLLGSLGAELVRGRRAGGAGKDAEADSARPSAARPVGRVRVEVLNASGVPGLAAQGRTLLRDVGYDVVQVGNAAGFAPDSSLVLDRVGRMETARAVADEIGIPRVYARPDSNLYVDVTVVLGRDWAAATDSAPPPEPE
jgi:hypothetical protein